MKITLRIFPANRRASFTSIDINIDNNNFPTVKDILKLTHIELKEKYKVARGIKYLDMDDILISGETLNVIPI